MGGLKDHVAVPDGGQGLVSVARGRRGREDTAEEYVSEDGS
jgi:hypothetical protein